MTTRYHVAGERYAEGEDLYCWDELEAMGEPVEWKYDGEPADTDVVCLFETLDEARTFQAEWAPSGTILAVTLPDDISVVHVDEGFPAVFGHIDARYLEVVR